MEKNMRVRLALSFVIACGAIAAGCGGSGKECGEGTVEMDGRCVPAEAVTCGTGTQLDSATGMCVPTTDPVTCGTGTTLNPSTGMCVANVTCAEGTVAMGNECVPDGSVICTGNTMFDAETGTCVIDETACAEGTVLVGGECVVFDDSLVADVHAGAEPDDALLFDGTPVVFTPPALGEHVTLDGCITPANFDGDAEGVIDPDIDMFAFSVSGPGLFDMRIDGLNGLSAGFAVISPDPALEGWYRIGLDLTNDGASRKIWLPRAGQYFVMTFDSRSLALDSLADTFSVARPVGSADTCYFMSIEALATPTPTALTTDTRMGQLGDPQFFTVARTGVVQSMLSVDAASAVPALVVTDGTDVQSASNNPTALAFSPMVADGETLTIVVDHVFNYAISPVEYTLRLTTLSRMPEDGTLELPYVQDEFSFFYFEATSGDVLELEWQAGDLDLRFLMFGPGLTLMSEPPAGETSFTYLADGGRYIVGIVNNDESYSMPTISVTMTSHMITPATLTVGTAGAMTLDRAFGFARVDASSVEWGVLALANLMGTEFTSADIAMFGATESGILDLPGFAIGARIPRLESEIGETGLQRIWGTAPGELLIAVGDTTASDGDETVEVTLSERMFEEVTLMTDMPVTRANVVIAAGGTQYYLVRAGEGSPVTLTVTGEGGADPTIQVLDRTGTAVSTVDVTAADGTEVANVFVTGSGWAAFAVDAGLPGGTVDIEFLAEPPPYTITAGTRTFTDICSTGVEILDADDAITPLRTHTLPGFAYFGAAANQMRISTNGWLTMDSNYTSNDSHWRGSIPSSSAPNALIAPAWHDMNGTVCVLENTAEVIVQWTGGLFLSSDTVEMQAILYADGRIDFVYGANHTVTPAEGQHGLESPTGDFALRPPVAMVGPSRSIRFTPN
jgi:hypothetical protein